MQTSPIFRVYNASAGSGKTFTLVKEYLKILLQSSDLFLFQKILAITFTNKAANEMKERILLNLKDFSEGHENDLLKIILAETALSAKEINIRSKKVLENILQNYAAFSITTIDSFTHKIIKSFAFDLGLSLNFEVEMDSISLLNEAVDVLISKIGTEEEITQLLIQFSLDKIDDDKTWDITRELNDISNILLNENDAKHFDLLSSKTITDFTTLKKKLTFSRNELREKIKNTGLEALNIIEKENLKPTDFSRGTFPKFLKDLGEFNTKFDYKKRSETIDKAVENHNFYTKTASLEIRTTIERILPSLLALFEESKKIYGQLMLTDMALKNIIPLAVLNHIHTELNTIKEENNIRLHAEFNQLIASNIQNQPTPFIYEKIGQRFMHYFIDEMQDTSTLQWNNLIPLIDNALAQENSSLLLVGDGKQAIYRWRGGKAEQFINLGLSDSVQASNPFQAPKITETLETNFRSYSEIINFNNEFFQHVALFLQNLQYQQIFKEGNHQLENSKKGGYVSIDFLERITDTQENNLKYPKKVLETIKELETTHHLHEICILVRKKIDGINIANYLAENNIPIVSSETLLLKNNAKVNFITHVLQLIQHPSDKETQVNILYFLHQHLSIDEDKHLFLEKHSTLTPTSLLEKLKNYCNSFNLLEFNQLPFYEKIEEIIRGFTLTKTYDAYIQYFLDIVLEQQRNGADIQSFLDYWEVKKESLSIVVPENTDAVQIMTIHKSKGLEFPVVIFPCDLDIYQQINPKVWLPELPESFGNFKEFLIPFNKNLDFISELGAKIYQKQREELELDNFNLLYVALTRAVKQLHIITEYKINKAGENTNFYSGIFINYLKKKGLWNQEIKQYSFGNVETNKVIKKAMDTNQVQKNFISLPWKKHNIQLLANTANLWNAEQKDAIEYGNLIHEIMASIYTPKDISKTIEQYATQKSLSKELRIEIENKIIEIVKHSEMSVFFSDNAVTYTEREIIDVDNQIIIPDRISILGEQATIIDYKTGTPSKSHHQQVLKYANTLQSLGFSISKKLLVYINEEILVEEV